MNCGCRVVHEKVEGLDHRYALTIDFCPIHAAAEEMQRALVYFVNMSESEISAISAMSRIVNIAKKVLAKAEKEATNTKSKPWHCAKCGKKMQFYDGICFACSGGKDPGD